MTDSQPLQIARFSLGPIGTNAYVLIRPSGKCFIVDPGQDPEPLIEAVKEQSLTPLAILLTHAHYDHIGGVQQVCEAFGADMPIWIHSSEKDYPSQPAENLSLNLGLPMVAPDPTDLFEHGHKFDLDGLSIEVRHTPGHSPGGCSFYIPDVGVVVCGDALFAGSIGRTDFPHSDHQALISGVRSQLLTLPGETIVLPGHGPETSVEQEKAHNPYVGDRA